VKEQMAANDKVCKKKSLKSFSLGICKHIPILSISMLRCHHHHVGGHC
jgi:hypothetical protein